MLRKQQNPTEKKNCRGKISRTTFKQKPLWIPKPRCCVMREKEFSNWTHFREQRDNCRFASGVGKKENQPWSSGSLLRDSHRAPHGPAASGPTAEVLPIYSQPVGSVTGMRTPLHKCHRKSGGTMELPRVCKCLAHTLSHREGQNHLGHFSRRDRAGAEPGGSDIPTATAREMQSK